MIFTSSSAMGINDLHTLSSEAQKCCAGSYIEDRPNFSFAKESNCTVNGVASTK